MNRERWIMNLADYSKPLRDLIGQIPIGFLLYNRNTLDRMVAKRVPVLRATWFIKMISNQPKETDPETLCRMWTDTIIHVLDTLFTRAKSAAKRERQLADHVSNQSEGRSLHELGSTELYMIEIICHCIDEDMVDVARLEQWFISKLMTSHKIGQDQLHNHHAGPNMWYQESFFASERVLTSFRIDKLSQDFTSILSKVCVQSLALLNVPTN